MKRSSRPNGLPTKLSNASTNSLYTMDVHVKLHGSTGVFEWFVNGSKVGSGTTGDTIHDTAVDMDQIMFANNVSNITGYSFYSQMCAMDESTIGAKVVQHKLDGAGVTQEFVGDYTDLDVNGSSVFNGATIASSDTADEIELGTVDALPAHSLMVHSVAVNAQGKVGSTGPQNANVLLRSGGANYFSSDQSVGVGFSTIAGIWPLDPDGDIPWEDAAVTR